MFSYEFHKLLKYTFFHETFPVAVYNNNLNVTDSIKMKHRTGIKTKN